MKTGFVLGLLLVGCGGDDAGVDLSGSSGGTSHVPSKGGSGGQSSSGGSANTGGVGGKPAGAGNAGTTSDGGTGAASSAGGGSGGDTGGSGSGGSIPYVPPDCENPVIAGLPEGAPDLEPGVWTDITPASHVALKGTAETMIAQGMALDPCQPTTIYWGTTPFDSSVGGLFKSTDAGGSWKQIGAITPDWTGTDHVDEPLHVRVDPNDSQHLYVGDGVRGGTQGFWVSYDGGETLEKPPGWVALEETKTMTMADVYDIAVDPADFNHALASFHGAWGWTDTEWNTNSGVLETTDGGETFIVHKPGSWGTGHSINFYDPVQGIGNKDTWLLGTQGGGYFRTSDAGESWTKVADHGIFHGGGTVFYSATGVLYASGYPSSRRSTDNGLTWTGVGPSGGGTTCIYGDGDTLWTAPTLGDNPYFTSPESDGTGTEWTKYEPESQNWHNGGPFEMAVDPVNRILYSSNWEQGIMAIKLP